MKLKIQISEGFHTTIWRKPITIDTDKYPELKYLSKEDAIEYIQNNSNHMQLQQEGLEMEWSLLEELTDQDVEITKEKSFETQVWEYRV
jgi:hypothetical protein